MTSSAGGRLIVPPGLQVAPRGKRDQSKILKLLPTGFGVKLKPQTRVGWFALLLLHQRWLLGLATCVSL